MGGCETPLLAVEVASRDGELYRVFIEGSVKIGRARCPAARRARRQFARRGHDARERGRTRTTPRARRNLRRSDTLRAPKPLAEGGMYPHERAADAARNAALFVRKTLSKMRVTSS